MPDLRHQPGAFFSSLLDRLRKIAAERQIHVEHWMNNPEQSGEHGVFLRPAQIELRHLAKTELDRMESHRERTPLVTSANDLLKARFHRHTGCGIVASAVLHAALLAFFPKQRIALQDGPRISGVPIAVSIDLRVPPPPAPVLPPAASNLDQVLLQERPDLLPVLDSIDLAPPLLDPVYERGYPQLRLSPVSASIILPVLLNPSETIAQLERRTRRTFQQALATTVVLWLFVDRSGAVRDVGIAENSGNLAFDRIALETISAVGKFSAAKEGGRPVDAWVEFPVHIEVVDEPGSEERN